MRVVRQKHDGEGAGQIGRTRHPQQDAQHRGMNPDRMTSIPNGKSHSPQKIEATSIPLS